MNFLNVLQTLSFVAVLTGCGQAPVIPNGLPVAQPESSALPNSLKILSQTSLDVSGGGLAVASNGDYVVTGGLQYGVLSQVMTSSDGVTWTNQGTLPGDCAGLATMGSSIFATVTSYKHATGTSEYQTAIFQSTDNGRTWNQFTYRDDYYVMFSVLKQGTKIGVALQNVPVMPGTSDGHGNWVGYMHGSVDFGWFDSVDGSIEVVGRMASTDDEPGNFPSEVFVYSRPSDGALMAGVRWGEAPQIPYNKMKISTDGGSTWTNLGSEVWGGYAGYITICQTQDGKFWANGYQKQNADSVNSAVWQFDPETAQILQTNYPLGAISPDKNAGNGGMICQGNTLVSVLEDGPLVFQKLEYTP